MVVKCTRTGCVYLLLYLCNDFHLLPLLLSHFITVLFHLSCSFPVQREKSTHSLHGGQVPCLFTAKLQLTADSLYYEPRYDDFQAAMQKLLQLFKDCVLGKPNLIPDSLYHSFTR